MIPKHGKDSAHTKKCKQYRERNRRAVNKEKHMSAQQRFEAKQKAKNVTR